MMAHGIHCWCLSITLYLMYSGYTLFWWPRVYIAGVYLYHYTLCTLDTHSYDWPLYTLLEIIYNTILYVPWIHIVTMAHGIHSWCLSISLYLVYSGYTLLWWPRVYIGGPFYNTTPYVLWIHIVMMTLDIHCWCLSITLLYLMYSGYSLLWWPRVYIAGAYLYHYTLCTWDTHGYDDPGYTLLVLIYNTLPYYSGYTLIGGPRVYIACAYL